MATLTFVDYDAFIEDLFEKVHNFGSDTFKIALTNTAPTVATDDELADITEIAAGNGYTAGGNALTVTSSSQTSGTYSFVITNDVTFTASGGTMATWRYAVLYNDTATNDELVSYWDTGSTQSLGDGESYTFDISGVTLLSGTCAAA